MQQNVEIASRTKFSHPIPINHRTFIFRPRVWYEGCQVRMSVKVRPLVIIIMFGQVLHDRLQRRVKLFECGANVLTAKQMETLFMNVILAMR